MVKVNNSPASKSEASASLMHDRFIKPGHLVDKIPEAGFTHEIAGILMILHQKPVIERAHAKACAGGKVGRNFFCTGIFHVAPPCFTWTVPVEFSRVYADDCGIMDLFRH